MKPHRPYRRGAVLLASTFAVLLGATAYTPFGGIEPARADTGEAQHQTRTYLLQIAGMT